MTLNLYRLSNHAFVLNVDRGLLIKLIISEQYISKVKMYEPYNNVWSH